MRLKVIQAALVCLFIQACGSDSRPGEGSLETSCEGNTNLLDNPAFLTNSAGAYSPWSGAQHAGEMSFEASAREGTLRIEKVGSQPWFTFSQSVAARSLRGQELLYTAEVRLDLQESESHGFGSGGGLQVSVWGDPDPVMGGDRLVQSSKFEHQPRLGQHDWTPVSVRVQVPRDATRMRVGFAHYAEGVLEVRQPALYSCGEAKVGVN